MLLKRFTDFILRSRRHTWGTAFVISFIPLLGSISIIMVGFITLVRGAKEGFYLLGVVLLPLLITLYLEPAGNPNSFGPGDIIGCYAAITILTWAAAVLLRQYGSWNLLLQLAALLGIVLVLCAYIVNPDIQSWWQTHLTNYFSDALKASDDMTDDKITAVKASTNGLVSALKPFITGFLATFIVFWALLQLLLARWWQAAIYNPGGLRKELCNIRLSYAAGMVSFVIALLLFTESPIVVDMASVIVCTYVIAGFSVLQVLLNNTKKAWLWNTLIYAAIILVPFGMMLVGVLALVDTFFNLRRFIPKQQIGG
jgi:hypothetical protein